MLIRIATILLVGHLIFTEFVPSTTALNSEINWWTYVIKRDVGLDRIEQAFRDISRR